MDDEVDDAVYAARWRKGRTELDKIFQDQAVQLRDLARDLQERIRRTDLTGRFSCQIDWTARENDTTYWSDQVAHLEKALINCRFRSNIFVRDGSFPPQPEDRTTISPDILPEEFYHALPTQPPSPTIRPRRRTTIARQRRFRKLLSRKPDRNWDEPRVVVVPSTETPMVGMWWPSDWTEVYEIHAQNIWGNRDMANFGSESYLSRPEFDRQELDYWQQLCRKNDEAALRHFFSSPNPPSTPEPKPSKPSVCPCHSAAHKDEGPIASRLRSANVPIPSPIPDELHFKSCPFRVSRRRYHRPRGTMTLRRVIAANKADQVKPPPLRQNKQLPRARRHLPVLIPGTDRI